MHFPLHRQTLTQAAAGRHATPQARAGGPRRQHAATARPRGGQRTQALKTAGTHTRAQCLSDLSLHHSGCSQFAVSVPASFGLQGGGFLPLPNEATSADGRALSPKSTAQAQEGKSNLSESATDLFILKMYMSGGTGHSILFTLRMTSNSRGKMQK